MKNSSDTIVNRTRNLPTCSTVHQPAALLTPLRSPIQWVPDFFFPGIKRLGRDVDHSSLSGAVVKNEWSCSSFMPQWRGHGQLYLLVAVSKNVSHIFKLIEYFMEKVFLWTYIICRL